MTKYDDKKSWLWIYEASIMLIIGIIITIMIMMMMIIIIINNNNTFNKNNNIIIIILVPVSCSALEGGAEMGEVWCGACLKPNDTAAQQETFGNGYMHTQWVNTAIAYERKRLFCAVLNPREGDSGGRAIGRCRDHLSFFPREPSYFSPCFSFSYRGTTLTDSPGLWNHCVRSSPISAPPISVRMALTICTRFTDEYQLFEELGK